MPFSKISPKFRIASVVTLTTVQGKTGYFALPLAKRTFLTLACKDCSRKDTSTAYTILGSVHLGSGDFQRGISSDQR